MSEETDVGSMVSQLGTSPDITARNKVDMRILSVIQSSDKLPDTYHALLYSRIRYRVVILRERFWTVVQDEMLHLPISINGRGRNDQVKGELASKGYPVNTDPAPQTPGVFDRLKQNEKYREFEEWKERQEMGLE